MSSPYPRYCENRVSNTSSTSLTFTHLPYEFTDTETSVESLILPDVLMINIKLPRDPNPVTNILALGLINDCFRTNSSTFVRLVGRRTWDRENRQPCSTIRDKKR